MEISLISSEGDGTLASGFSKVEDCAEEDITLHVATGRKILMYNIFLMLCRDVEGIYMMCMRMHTRRNMKKPCNIHLFYVLLQTQNADRIH